MAARDAAVCCGYFHEADFLAPRRAWHAMKLESKEGGAELYQQPQNNSLFF
jgi:hypothetical protein